MDDLNSMYFEWMYGIATSDREFSARRPYLNLIRQLQNTEFVPILGHDCNRADDGIRLRYRFADANDIPHTEVADKIDIRPCSMLEMMLALAIRCEEDITGDMEYGCHAAKWFWVMIRSMGLDTMTDYVYDEEQVRKVLLKFMKREYKRNGSGGLFQIDDDTVDMRTTEIWYQMHRYLIANY